MSKLQRQLIGVLFLNTLPLAPAGAADLYRGPSQAPASYIPPAAYVDQSWTGFYAGINGGYGWGEGGNSIGYNGGFANGDTSSRAQPQGGFGGGQIGYNFQSGSIVYGVETDFQGGDLSNRITGTSADGNSFSSHDNVDWFGTVRGRLGYSLGRTLIYGTGGFAYGDVRQHANIANAAGTDSASLGSSNTQAGWVAGGGIEYKITPSWSLKGEYQYIDLGSEKLSGTDIGTGATVSTNGLDTSFSTVKIGVNYLFGGGPAPLK